MSPGINGLSHADTIAVLNQLQHGRSAEHTVQPQALRAALLDAWVLEKPLSARRVRDNDLALPEQPPPGILADRASEKDLPPLEHGLLPAATEDKSGHRTETLTTNAGHSVIGQRILPSMGHFFADAQALLDGYQHFLQWGDTSESAIKTLMRALKPLRESLAAIQAEAVSREAAITDPVLKNRFATWLNNAEELKHRLQMISLPEYPAQLRTDDVIYFIHERFAKVPESVTVFCGLGTVEKTGLVTITRCPAQASGENLLTASLRQAINAMNALSTKVLDLPSACIVSGQLGFAHGCSLAMFEQAGRGRSLRLVVTENIAGPDHLLGKQGQLKRMWFLAHLILCKSPRIAGIKIALHPSAAALTVAIPHIESTPVMQQTFLSLTRLLGFLHGFDAAVSYQNIIGSCKYKAWDYGTVRKMIDKSTDRPVNNHWPYKVCLVGQGIRRPETGIYLQGEVSTEHLVFFQAGKVFGELIAYYEAIKLQTEPDLKLNPDTIEQRLTDMTQSLPTDDIDRVKRELSLILFGFFPEEFIVYMQEQYPDDMADDKLLKSLPTDPVRMNKVLRNNLKATSKQSLSRWVKQRFWR